MLRADGLTKAYRGTEVVTDVDLQLSPGHIVGLVGANGAGKTTTIKMLAGLVEPTRGTAVLDRAPTLEPAARARIGLLPEASSLYEEQTPREYLRFFASLYDVPLDTADERAERFLARLRLDRSAWTKPIGTMSKGMRRKVAIARALLHDPDVLLLDEPTSGLDPVTAGELNTFIRELRGEGKAILLSAHDLTQVEELCDTIVVMHEGQVALRGSLTELRDAVGTKRYIVRATHPFDGSQRRGGAHEAELETWDAVEDVSETIRSNGGDVLEVESVLPGLDEVIHRVAEV